MVQEKDGAVVDVINVGGAETESTLRKALAIGADAAIRIDTAALGGPGGQRDRHGDCCRGL